MYQQHPVITMETNDMAWVDNILRSHEQMFCKNWEWFFVRVFNSFIDENAIEIDKIFTMKISLQNYFVFPCYELDQHCLIHSLNIQ